MRFLGDKVNKYTYKDLKDGIVYLKNNVKELVTKKVLVHGPDTSIDYKSHGPAYTHAFDPQTSEYLCKEDTCKKQMFKIRHNRSVDVVFCIRGKQWPVEASEWTTRIRTSNWPTKELFGHIINTGYLLA